jgi:hypothetical protein
LTPFRDALQVFSASLRKPARRYDYRGLKIITSLTLRFQDFQREPEPTSFCTKRCDLKTWSALIFNPRGQMADLFGQLLYFAPKLLFGSNW